MSPLRLAVVALPALLLALPFALRPAPVPEPERQVVVITPHGEAIRSEFGAAFTAWARRELGIAAGVDWRTPGGTGDIVRGFDARYAEAFAARFPQLDAHRATDPSLPPSDPARSAFLGSDLGCGADVFFGGGEFPHRQQAAKGYLADAGLLAEAAAAMPEMLSGERMYDREGRYYGACLSAFGIAVNHDRLAALGLDPQAQMTWRSLGDPALLGAVVIADPTRSGAVATAFERVLQEAMSSAAADPGHPTAEELERGWSAGWNALRRMAGNAPWWSDGASRAVRSVARGDAAAGMCIDFHARAEAEWSQAASGAARLSFVVPRGGTSVSADPISLLRGARDRELAVHFIRFVLSPEGQRLWNQRPGTPGGPQRYALRRLPIRRDSYAPGNRALMSDPAADPFADAAAFTYRPALTGPLFTFIPLYARAILIDPRDELGAAWAAIVRAGGPEAVPAAWAEFSRQAVPYAEARAVLAAMQSAPARRLELLRTLAETSRAQYRRAAALAAEGR